MNQKNIIQCKKEMPSTHFLVYRNKNYPINFDFFKIISKYVKKNEAGISKSQYIKLLNPQDEEHISIDDETINDFILYVQREPIEVHDKNASILNFLGRQYEIEELIEGTNEYILQNQSKIALDQLSIIQNKTLIDPSIYEQIISDNFLDYINDNRIFNLQIPTLYRIIKRLKISDIQSKDDFYNFLFTCLDRYGKSASVLFECIEIDQMKPQQINLLNTKYSKIFDFHFINSNFIKNVYDTENQIHLLVSQNEEKMRKIEEKNRLLVVEVENLKKLTTEREKEFIKVVEKMKKDHDDEMAKMRREEEERLNQLKIQLDEMINDRKIEKKKIDSIDKDTKTSIDEIKHEINELKKFEKQIKEDQENPKITKIQYNNQTNNRFSGLLNFLGQGQPIRALTDGIINITASSIVNTKDIHQPRNALIYDDDKKIFHSKDEPNSWLCVDFKERKVNITHYSIKSHGYGGKGYCHPQTWSVEGSNDSSHWEELDSRSNEGSLDDRSASNTFEARNEAHKRNYYRYVRIMQKGKNTRNDNCFAFSSIEFFGSIENK